MDEFLNKIQNFAKTITTVIISLFAIGSSSFILKSILYPQAVVIEQISVPASMEERGIKNEIIIQRILDEIQLLRIDAKIDRAENAIFGAISSKPDAQIDATFGGVSLKSIEYVLSEVFDRKPKKIFGEITQWGDKDSGNLQVRIRINNQVISSRSVTKDEADKNNDVILRLVAFDIYSHFEPFRAALAASKQGRSDDARQALRPLIISSDSNDRKYALWLRSTLSPIRQRELDLLEALSIDSNFTLALVTMAALERDRRNFELSIDYAERAIKSDPTAPNGYHEKGRTLRAQEQLDAAIGEFTKACSQKNPYAPCFNQIGEINLIKADNDPTRPDGFRKAYAEFIKAIRIDPLHAWAYSNAAYAALRAGDPKDAQLLVKRARELDPETPSHIIRYAAITAKLGNKECPAPFLCTSDLWIH
jgi:tetratricopeptide (TPR) repeat protein